ncbi:MULTISPECIES: permease [Legionella]|uniref:Permease n=1 Tax=Legionella resiliens TaxID=2905958 RepID=A0ABS8X5W1_9GAMM|nr:MULTISPECIES: permease [unclassified Legionella]MCE0723568.1 permease [Legionella sp. 9fVS26]MCE3532722.1 permease [Legionella sp. 8cVS16]
MIYLSIPVGMVFRKMSSGVRIRDCFVDPQKGTVIELQDLVKEALRNNTGRKSHVVLKENEFTIYLSTPPNTDDSFLAYVPNHNGKYPTAVKPEIVSGKSAQKYDPKYNTKYGSFWYQQILLTTEQELEIEDKMLEQRENRRHTGSSPNAT